MRRRRERLKAWQESKIKNPTSSSAEPTASSPSEAPTIRNIPPAESIPKQPEQSPEKPDNTLQSPEPEPEIQPVPRWTLEDDDDADIEEETTAIGETTTNESDVFLPALQPSKTIQSNEEETEEQFMIRSKRNHQTISSQLKSSSHLETIPSKPYVSSKESKVSQIEQPKVEEDIDPLDAFMSDLYGSGEVANQKAFKELSSNKSQTATNPPLDKSDSASNVITLDEILMGIERNEPSKQTNPSLRRGWESDVGESTTNSPNPHSNHAATGNNAPSGESEEQREDRERKEFMEAIRLARQEEELARERLIKLDQEHLLQQQTLTKQKNIGSETGRIFNDEGDILDETAISEKNKSALELLEEAKKGKQLKEIDHNKIQYIPFRKNLYIVPKTLAKLTEEETIKKRDTLQIKVRGKNCPAPVDTWEQCGLSDRILKCIYDYKLQEPFPIQKQSIPAIMCGRDVIGVAKTGSGKTLAFLLPMFRHILDQPPLLENEGPIGLIMAPARELASQIYIQAKKFTKYLGMRVACIYGGAGVAEQIADLKRGSEIVVCTPGRMIDILTMQAGKLVSLKRVTMVVLDEADRMFDMGFEPQIKMILQNIRPDRQAVLFSATFPKKIESLAKSVLKFPLEIVVGERSTVNKDITQYIEVHEDEDKFLRLLQLLGVWYDKGSVLIFVDKQEKCDQLYQELLKLGYPCLSLHGGKDQVDRDHTLHEFKTGIKTVMIATSVAGRGLDVPEIVCVINYHCPNHFEDYVHRVGRTGRAGRKGTAYTFISSKEEQYAPIMVKALEKADQPIPPELLEMSQSFKEKVERGEAFWSNSGFVGKGFTFDASEMNEAQKATMMQKKAYAMEEGLLPEKSEVEDIYEDFDEEYQEEIRSSSSQALTSTSSNNLAAESSLGDANNTGNVDAKAALARARQIAMQLINSGSTSTAVKKADGRGGDHYSDELEINDYPFQVRRKVTNRNTLDEITERTGVAIISRGNYIPPTKKLDLGEKKLHLLIEGASELSVRQAKMEILRALEEETLKMSASTPQNQGRYSVI